jgi:urea carboxylase
VSAEFETGKPWLLRFFDQIRFYPVTENELLDIREKFPHGKYSLKIEETVFDLNHYNRFLQENEKPITIFKQKQQAAFSAERQRWQELGEMRSAGVQSTVTAG